VYKSTQIKIGNLTLGGGAPVRVQSMTNTDTSTHCFLEGGRPVSLEKRFPEFYARVKEVIREK